MVGPKINMRQQNVAQTETTDTERRREREREVGKEEEEARARGIGRLHTQTQEELRNSEVQAVVARGPNQSTSQRVNESTSHRVTQPLRQPSGQQHPSSSSNSSSCRSGVRGDRWVDRVAGRQNE